MGTGKKKIPVKKIENLNYRRVTYCKRRRGLFTKADKLSVLTGCRVAILTLSTANKPIFHGDRNLILEAAAAAKAASSSSFGNLNSLEVGSFYASKEAAVGFGNFAECDEGADDGKDGYFATDELAENAVCSKIDVSRSDVNMIPRTDTSCGNDSALLMIPFSSSAMSESNVSDDQLRFADM